VNLLGEHTDYNDGYVLPTIIPQTTAVDVARSRDGLNRFHSEQLASTVSYRVGEDPVDGFALYIHGCIELLREQGHEIAPLALHVDSQVFRARALRHHGPDGGESRRSREDAVSRYAYAREPPAALAGERRIHGGG
jgi:hypothetical protein